MGHKYNLTVTEFVRLYSDKLNEKIYGPLGIKQMYYVEDIFAIGNEIIFKLKEICVKKAKKQN